MKILQFKYFLATASLLLTSMTLQSNNSLVEAMMKVYAEELANNPQDYETYYSRAMAYVDQGKMDEALADIDNAIKYYPRKEKEDLAQAYLLRARILIERDENQLALSDLDNALSLSPRYSLALIERGNLLCELGEYAKAKTDFNQLLNISPRNQNAYMGLARIEAKNGQVVRAKDLLAQAVNLSPYNPQIYLERSAIYKEMKMIPEAVDDLIYATALTDDQSDAILQLMQYSRESYSEVIEGLNRNITRYPQNGLLYYLRATIYNDHYDFRSALQDWNKILAEEFFTYHLIYYNRANALFHLGKFDEARADIKHALEEDDENIKYLSLLSEIERSAGNLQAADEAIRQAALYNPSDMWVCLDRGMIAYDEGNSEKALRFYNEAVLAAPNAPLPYLMRAFNQELGLGNIDEANIDYRKVLSLDNTSDFYGDNLKGIAAIKLGNQEEAQEWERTLLAEKTIRSIDYFHLACLYANTDVDKAISYLEQAIQNGFSDYYRIHIDRYSPLTLAPIRHTSQYSDLLRKYRTSLGQ